LQRPDPYTPAGGRFLGTWPHGAVTVRSHRTGLVVETFVTGQRFAVRSAGGQSGKEARGGGAEEEKPE
jgi:hypothetical protein